MTFCDFVVNYTDDRVELTRRILYSVFVQRVKKKKPCVTFIQGDSGEGKSTSTLALMQELLAIQGIDFEKHIEDCNVCLPFEYPTKINRLLHSQELKKVNVIGIHEARTIVKAKDWNSFLTQTIADVQALSRSIKPLMFFIVSQFIRDITTDIRYTLNFYCKSVRPRSGGCRLYVNVLWKDDRDLDKPKLMRRKLYGYVILPNGIRKSYAPRYLEVSLPSKTIMDKFDEMDTTAKSAILKKKIEKLIQKMQQDAGVESGKVAALVDYYTASNEKLADIGKMSRGKFKIEGKFKKMHDMTDTEWQDFTKLVNERLEQRGKNDGSNTGDAVESIGDFEGE